LDAIQEAFQPDEVKAPTAAATDAAVTGAAVLVEDGANGTDLEPVTPAGGEWGADKATDVSAAGGWGGGASSGSGW
jgi:hypothetical protein